MAGTGPPPKPGERRQRRNVRTSTSRAGAGLVALPTGTVEPPSAPTGLLKPTREAWAALWQTPLAALLTPADRPALERLFTLYDERVRAYRGLRSIGRLVEGEKGVTLNPLASYMKACDAEVRHLEDRFGLTPMARLRLGVQLGEAAKSLEDLNQSLDGDDADDDEPVADPRVRVVDATGGSAPADLGSQGGPVGRADPRPRGG
jgi:P27 family predicted phage terminase small subunit